MSFRPNKEVAAPAKSLATKMTFVLASLVVWGDPSEVLLEQTRDTMSGTPGAVGVDICANSLFRTFERLSSLSREVKA